MLYICYCHDGDRKSLPGACQQRWRTFLVLYDSNRSAETGLQSMCIVAKGRIYACASYLHAVRFKQKVMSNILPGHNACLYHSSFPFFSRRQICKSLWLEGPGSALSYLNQSYGLRDCFAYCRLDPWWVACPWESKSWYRDLYLLCCLLHSCHYCCGCPCHISKYEKGCCRIRWCSSHDRAGEH